LKVRKNEVFADKFFLRNFPNKTSLRRKSRQEDLCFLEIPFYHQMF